MKTLTFFFAVIMLIACSNSPDTDPSSRDTIPQTKYPVGTDPSAVMFKVTDEEALRLVSEVKEINEELKRAFDDKTVRNQLVLVQPASPEDANHYIQLMEMHDDRGVTLAHFRVDAMTGEIRVMDPLSEGETWVTLEQWRKIKL